MSQTATGRYEMVVLFRPESERRQKKAAMLKLIDELR